LSHHRNDFLIVEIIIMQMTNEYTMLKDTQTIDHPRKTTAPRNKRYRIAKYSWQLRLVRFVFSTFGSVFPKFLAQKAFSQFVTPQKKAKHKVSDLIMEQARVFEFMFKGKLLKGYKWGHGTQTILLVHGWESRGTALRSFVPVLLEKGYKVVAFDGPAHGNSAGKQTNILEFAGAIKAIINQVGGVFGIIAHSFGGASTVYALSHLEQTKPLKRLVLIASLSRMMTGMENFLRLIRASKKLKDEFYSLSNSIFSVPLKGIDTATMHDKVDIEKTLLIHDKEDRIIPFASSERVEAHWPDTTFLTTEGYGHFGMVKEMKVLKAVADFIERE